MKKLTLALLILSLCLALLTACGGGSQEETTEPETASAETETTETEDAATAEEEDPILGFWFAQAASKDGTELDPYEVFGGTFYLYFVDEGECQMCIDDKRAPGTWERTENGITLKGDDTYDIVYPTDTPDTMILTVKGVEVVLEKDTEE